MRRLISLRPRLATAAQEAYDRWEQDEEGVDVELGSGGACQDIADAMAGTLQEEGIDSSTIDSEGMGDQHVWVVAWDESGGFQVDIPPSVYETGSGYVWRKRKNVTFSPDHIVISPAEPETVQWVKGARFRGWYKNAATSKKVKFHLPDWLDDKFEPSDLGLLMSRLSRACAKHGFKQETLGIVANHPMLAFHNGMRPGRPSILLAAGFHGEEPAGCWGLLRFLEMASTGTLDHFNLTVMPVVNPTGIKNDRRENDLGETPNNAMVHVDKKGKDPEGDTISAEGRILLAHMDWLRPRCQDGFLTLHEDEEMEDFFIYTYERSDTPTWRSETLVDVGSMFFSVRKDSETLEPEKGCCKGGIVFNDHDGSCEDRLFHEGCKFAVTTETPGNDDFKQRMLCCSELVRVFLGIVS